MKYTPDFILPNGIIAEVKAYLDVEDRMKHLFIKSQHPGLDIRFVFSRSASPLWKSAKSTCSDWCRKNGFQFADKIIPQSWIDEPASEPRLAAFASIKSFSVRETRGKPRPARSNCPRRPNVIIEI